MLNLSLSWSLPPADLVLSSPDVHVWCASLEQSDRQVQQLSQTLSEDEQARAKRFYFERDRKHFTVGRGLLRTILSRYTGIASHQLQFCYGSRGKPALATQKSSTTIQFNVSHSQGLVLYAVTCDRQIGIDLEQIRSTSDIEQLAKRFFSPREAAVICSLPPAQKQQAFFRGWTCKEAYLKAIGEGLAGLQQVEVSLVLEEPARLLSIDDQDIKAAAHWSVEMLTPAPGYMGAIAIEGHDWYLSCWQWPHHE